LQCWTISPRQFHHNKRVITLNLIMLFSFHCTLIVTLKLNKMVFFYLLRKNKLFHYLQGNCFFYLFFPVIHKNLLHSKGEHEMFSNLYYAELQHRVTQVNNLNCNWMDLKSVISLCCFMQQYFFFQIHFSNFNCRTIQHILWSVGPIRFEKVFWKYFFRLISEKQNNETQVQLNFYSLSRPTYVQAISTIKQSNWLLSVRFLTQ
jgi:hypothetical protein